MRMDSIQATVSMALQMQSANVAQNEQMTLLKNTLDAQKQAMEQLMEPVARLATSGSVGTRLHVTA